MLRLGLMKGRKGKERGLI